MNNFERAITSAVDHGADDNVQNGDLPSMDLLSAAVYADVLAEVAMSTLPDGMGLEVAPMAPEQVIDPFFEDTGSTDVSEVERYLSFDQRDDTFASLVGEGQDPFDPDIVPAEPQRTPQDMVREMLRNL